MNHVGIAPDGASPKATVLIVEDDPTLRWVIAELLAHAGFDVCEAIDADQAKHWLTFRADIRAILTDIELPGSMNGLDLAWEIRSAFPELAILISSGRLRPERAALPAGAEFLPKPLSPTQMIALLWRLLRTGGNAEDRSNGG